MNGALRAAAAEHTPLLAQSHGGQQAGPAPGGRTSGSGGGSSGNPNAAASAATDGIASSFVLWVLVISFMLLAAFTYKLMASNAFEQFVLAVDRDPYGFLLLFVAFYIAAVVMFFPTMILQVLSGALYHFYPGLLLSWFATSAGQCLAFLLGRYLFRRSVKAYLLERVPNFPLIEASMKKEGWKLMCLLRLSPVLPYNVLNYAAALTPIPFHSYALSSSIAIIPWTCLYVYLGTLTTDVAGLLRGEVPYTQRHSNMQLVSSALYMVLLAVTVVYGYVLSKRAINSALKSAADENPGGGVAPTEV